MCGKIQVYGLKNTDSEQVIATFYTQSASPSAPEETLLTFLTDCCPVLKTQNTKNKTFPISDSKHVSLNLMNSLIMHNMFVLSEVENYYFSYIRGSPERLPWALDDIRY